MKILTVGEIIWDVYPDKQCIGGAPLNFAAHTSLLGAEASMLSAVGDDALGRSAKDYVRDFGVSAKYIQTNDLTTGICDVSVTERGIPSYSARSNTAYDNLILTDHDIAEINNEQFDLFYFGTLIQRSAVSAAAVKRVLAECSFGDILCDINLRPNCYSRDSVLTCLTSATILKLSDEEEPLLRALDIYEGTPEGNAQIAKTLAAQFPNFKLIIITMGAKGAYAYRTSDGTSVMQAPIEVEVASTVGAGDSFAAAFSVAFLKGKTLKEAMYDGAELSSFIVSRMEAVPKLG